MPTVPDPPGGDPALQKRRSRWKWSGALLAFALLWHALFVVEPQRLQWFGLAQYPQFIDSMALLAAAEAAQLGFDVYRPNPLDPFGRAHSYPSVWLLLGDFGLTRADNTWFALLAIAIALIAAALTLQPTTLREFAEACFAVGGPGVLFAVYRANNDLWIFTLLALLVPFALHPSRLVKLGAPVVVAFATALKYYPVVAGVILLAEPIKRDRWLRLGKLVALLAMVGLGVLDDLRHVRDTQPVVDRFWSFGAVLALRGIGMSPEAAAIASVVMGATVTIVGLVAAWRLGGDEKGDAVWAERSFLWFLLGGALLAGCFWAGASWGYRWIFVLWLLPWFWRGQPARDVVGRIVRWGWWVPMWFAPLYVWGVRATGRFSPESLSVAWWASQAIEWVWFGALTVVLARASGGRWRRLGLRND